MHLPYGLFFLKSFGRRCVLLNISTSSSHFSFNSCSLMFMNFEMFLLSPSTRNPLPIVQPCEHPLHRHAGASSIILLSGVFFCIMFILLCFFFYFFGDLDFARAHYHISYGVTFLQFFCNHFIFTIFPRFLHEHFMFVWVTFFSNCCDWFHVKCVHDFCEFSLN